MRQPNPFAYQADPTQEIGSSLARALFGDPEMAQRQQQLRAEIAERAARTEEARAHAGLYGEQAAGQTQQNTAASGLSGMIAALRPPERPAPPETLDGFLSDDYQPQAPVSADQAFKGGIGNVIASLAQMQGDKVDPRAVVGSLASFFGGDELARRGLVAQGHTPDKDFALTPERADVIAQNLADAAYRKDTGVATINHATDLPVARIKAGADRDVATINNRDDITVAEIGAGSRENVAKIRNGGTVALDGNNPGGINDGTFAASLPGYVGSNGRYAKFATMADGEAAQSRLLGSYIARGFDTPAKIASRWAPAGDGNDATAYAARLASALGIGVNDRVGPGDVGRLQAAQARIENHNYSGGTGKPAKKINVPVSAMKGLDQEISVQLGGDAKHRKMLNTNDQTQVRARAAALMQGGADPASAVRKALGEAGNAARARKLRESGQPAGYPDAKKAPDGRWVVQRNGKWFEVKR